MLGLPNTFGEYDESPEYTGQMLQVLINTTTNTHAHDFRFLFANLSSVTVVLVEFIYLFIYLLNLTRVQ